MHSKQKVLESLEIGNGVAELERSILSSFFFESITWKKLRKDKIDFILGPKGSGKSALYYYLLEHESELHSEGSLIVSSENTSGGSVFSTLADDVSFEEADLIRIWKLYFLTLILDTCKKNGITSKVSERTEDLLKQEGIYEQGWSITQLFTNISNYIRSRLYFDAADGELELDPSTGVPKKIKAKLTFGSPTTNQQKLGIVSIDALLQSYNNLLLQNNRKVWILLDRLDAIFPNDRDKEKIALRSLVRVYAAARNLPAIRIKIFMRNDLWSSITKEDGFREASHLAPVTARLDWDKSTLGEMLLKRFLLSGEFRTYFRKDESFIKSNSNDKHNFLYSLFPDNMNLYGNKPQKSFDWLVMYTQDGLGVSAPRDLIELVNSAIEYEITRLEKGDTPYKQRNLIFNHQGLNFGGSVLSKTKMEQTIFAEFPECRRFIEAFIDSSGRNFDDDKLASVWGVKQEEARKMASYLCEIGVLKKSSTKSGATNYLIPVLYTNYLGINPSKRNKVG
ncbi:P-loop ATPase, Sll1717 family [Aliiroseovarius crassostreae]|uniref:P-loop ATPase, Sll1717 family n=1 Tax=Aliiroseovarius crassostreae TaxID=154981 RepID=UPI003C7CF888